MTIETLHGTTVAIDGHGVLILGTSGAGKSDLALRLIDRGAALVSDDYSELTVRDGRLIARPPATIAGRIEVRGIGIVAIPHAAEAAVALAVVLDSAPERLPPDRLAHRVAGLDIPAVVVDARTASAAIKVELALRRLIEGE